MWYLLMINTPGVKVHHALVDHEIIFVVIQLSPGIRWGAMEHLSPYVLSHGVKDDEKGRHRITITACGSS
jgi:hypothetical protein